MNLNKIKIGIFVNKPLKIFKKIIRKKGTELPFDLNKTKVSHKLYNNYAYILDKS